MAEAAEHHLAQVRSAQKRARDPSPSAHPMPPRPSVAESASFQVPAWERSNRARLSGGQLPVQAPADVSGPIVID